MTGNAHLMRDVMRVLVSASKVCLKIQIDTEWAQCQMVKRALRSNSSIFLLSEL